MPCVPNSPMFSLYPNIYISISTSISFYLIFNIELIIIMITINAHPNNKAQGTEAVLIVTQTNQ